MASNFVLTEFREPKMPAAATEMIDSETKPGAHDAEQAHDQRVDLTRTKGALLLPEPYNVCGLKIMAYSHPRAQACMLGSVLFLTVGTYNVITFLGGGGQQSPWLANWANIVLYIVFSAFCFIAPATLNYLGLRLTLFIGGFGYAAYAASLWCYNHTQNVGFVLFGGAWCGMSAAMLWTAEGTAITAYASEDKKGLYVSIMWSIFQAGVAIGAAIPVGQNWDAGTTNDSTVNDGTYIGLFILILIGTALSLVLYPWQKLVREDGSAVMVKAEAPSFARELKNSWLVIKRNPWILFFWPWCWAVNYYNIYQSNDFNGLVFTVRGRALNVLCSAVVQIAAAWVNQLVVDKLPFRRRVRAFVGALWIFIIFNAVWIGGYFVMRQTKEGLSESEKLDVYDPGYGKRAFLYVSYGFMDATYNCYAYWFIGALSNDPTELSVYAAMYRLLNALCQICAYSLDNNGYSIPFMFGTSWAFVAAGPVFVMPIIKYWMKDTLMMAEEDESSLHGSEGAGQHEGSHEQMRSAEADDVKA